MPEKKKWTTPKLIVLVRGKPEEAVLQDCKFYGGSGPDYAVDRCATEMGGCYGECSSSGGAS